MFLIWCSTLFVPVSGPLEDTRKENLGLSLSVEMSKFCNSKLWSIFFIFFFQEFSPTWSLYRQQNKKGWIQACLQRCNTLYICQTTFWFLFLPRCPIGRMECLTERPKKFIGNPCTWKKLDKLKVHLRTLTKQNTILCAWFHLFNKSYFKNY